MIIEDHIGYLSMAGMHPLVGPNDDRFGPRFPAVTNTYNRGLQAQLEECAAELKWVVVVMIHRLPALCGVGPACLHTLSGVLLHALRILLMFCRISTAVPSPSCWHQTEQHHAPGRVHTIVRP